MSVLFPKVNKPREWDFRPRYYDPEKEKQQKLRERMEQAKADYAASQRQAVDEADSTDSATPATETASARTETNTNRHATTLHRGSFREVRESAERVRHLTERRSKMVFWLAVLMIALLAYWLLS